MIRKIFAVFLLVASLATTGVVLSPAEPALAVEPGCYSNTAQGYRPASSDSCPRLGAGILINQFGACFVGSELRDCDDLNAAPSSSANIPAICVSDWEFICGDGLTDSSGNELRSNSCYEFFPSARSNTPDRYVSLPCDSITSANRRLEPGCYERFGIGYRILPITQCASEGAARSVSDHGACFVGAEEVDCNNPSQPGSAVPTPTSTGGSLEPGCYNEVSEGRYENVSCPSPSDANRVANGDCLVNRFGDDSEAYVDVDCSSLEAESSTDINNPITTTSGGGGDGASGGAAEGESCISNEDSCTPVVVQREDVGRENQCGKGDEVVFTAIDLGCRGDDFPGQNINPILDMAFAFFRLLSAGVGFVVIGSVVYAGIMYSASRGNPQAVEASIKRVTNSVIALVLYIFMFAIANFLVPGGLIG